MDTIMLTPPQKRWLARATIVALVIGVLFLVPYLRMIIISSIVAFLFNPLYKRFTAKFGRPGLAAMLTLIVSMLVIVIPLCLILLLTIGQTERLLSSLDSASVARNFNTALPEVIADVNRWLSSIGVSYQLTTGQITDLLKDGLATVGNAMLAFLTSSVGNFFNFFTVLILYMFVFTNLLRHQTAIRDALTGLNILGDDLGRLYAKRIGAMTKATIRGQFVIAIAQGFASSLGLYLAGVHGVFFFGLMLFTVLSIIPLGAGIVTIPAGIVLALLGNIWGGIFLIAWHLLVVTNIDNVLRPKLVPKEAQLNSALMLLAVFAGLAHFGFLGIVLGPVLMVVLVTTITVYLSAKPQFTESDGVPGKRGGRRWHIPGVRSVWRRGKQLLKHTEKA